MEKIEKELIDQKKVIVQSLSAQSEEYKKIMEEAAPGDEVDIASDVIDGKMLETNMDEIEQRIVLALAKKNLQRLMKEGQIRKTGYGTYGLPEE